MTEFVLDKPEQIAMFHVMQCRSALGLELNTGMKFSNRGNVAATAIACGYTSYDKNAVPARITKAIKVKVYGDLDKLITDNGGTARPLSNLK